MSNNFMRIPEELRKLKQWVVWRYEEVGRDKPTKVPYKAFSQTHASVTDPFTWSSFSECNEAYLASNGALNGLGFIFSELDPYTGIDLDASEDVAIIERQQKIFKEFDSYAERSPSGKGLHIIIKANVISGRRRSSIEMYSSMRFFTMTGDVFNDKPIAEHQELAQVLWEEMGRVKNRSNYLGEVNENNTDDEIRQQALAAVNGEKFKKLLEGNWNDIYPSQSEADFAFVDMVAFYTQSRNQIVRIFRASPLGQRDKAHRPDYVEYMLNKAFDRMLPPVDIEGLQNALEEAKAKKRLGLIPVTKAEAPTPKAAINPYDLPPGLLGEIASFIYQAAPRPVPEIALAAAVSFMAGLTGRAYNVSGTGLNQYVLLLAPTGTGKEAMASGIDRLVLSIRDEIPAIKDFIGPGEIASGQALLKYLSKTSASFLSIVGEFGLKMQQLSSRHANNSELMLKRVLLDLYNKSGNGHMLQAAIYSQKENSTEVVNSPAVTLLGESTPETFFTSIDESIIADGLLPRFTLVEYTGIRPPLNPNHSFVIPSPELKEKLALLTAHCLRLNNGVNNKPMAVDVHSTPEALKIANDFNLYADSKINGTDVSVIRHLWNRAHIKLLKLAALVAVGIDAYNPLIQADHIKWAREIVTYDIERLHSRFVAGNFGKDETETKQLDSMRKTFAHFLNSSYDAVKMYKPDESLHKASIIPYAYISKKLISQAVFRLDRMGATNAIKKTLASLIDSGYIKEIGKNELAQRFNTSQRAFMVADAHWILE